MKKRVFGINLAFFLCFVSFFGVLSCGDRGKNELNLSFYAPDGIGLVSAAAVLSGDTTVEGAKIKSQIVKGAAITPLILAATPDIAIAPVNVCILGQNDYTYLGTVVSGANFVLTRVSEASTLSDLKGEIVYAFQKDATPGLMLKAAIKEAEIEYKEFTSTDKTLDFNKINIEYLPDPATVRNALSFGYEGKGRDDFKTGLLAEPLVTAYLKQNSEFRRVELFDDWLYPQAGIIIKTSLLEENKELKEQILAALLKSSRLVLDDRDTLLNILFDKLQTLELPSKDILSDFLSTSKAQEIVGLVTGEKAERDVEAYLTKIDELNS